MYLNEYLDSVDKEMHTLLNNIFYMVCTPKLMKTGFDNNNINNSGRSSNVYYIIHKLLFCAR